MGATWSKVTEERDLSTSWSNSELLLELVVEMRTINFWWWGCASTIYIFSLCACGEDKCVGRINQYSAPRNCISTYFTSSRLLAALPLVLLS